MGDNAWILWMLIPLFFFMTAGRRNSWGCAPRSRRAHSSAQKNEEIFRLKQELETSQAQIDALKSRLEAVETIVTDEETELRRAFYKLQNS